jgi:hypothetical protein
MGKPKPKHGARLGAAILAGVVAVACASPAAATGMQGHIYMAQCAAEQATDPRLRALFDAQALHLANGAFFPDSGYTADDHDQGEIPHWEQYVEGYVELIRARYDAPFDGREAAEHVAFLMGIAAHGITDSTFDAILMDRAAQIEPGDMENFDAAMDAFLVHDLPRYYVPEIAVDAATQAEIFETKISHPVTVESIEAAMSTAWSGISAVSNFLYLDADVFGERYPWARERILDPRAPGGYAFGAKVVGRYYEELLRRIDGDTSADRVVIGTYPDASYPLATLDNTRPDGRILFFFGEGIDRASIDETTVVVRDDLGAEVPSTIGVFRGDTWANVITVTAQVPWEPGRQYTAVLRSDITTLSSASPSADLELTFTTCTPEAPGGDCEEPAGAPPPSPCPELDAKYRTWPGDPPIDPVASSSAASAGGDPPAAEADGGCALRAASGGAFGGWILVAVAGAAVAARLRAPWSRWRRWWSRTASSWCSRRSSSGRAHDSTRRGGCRP